VVAKAHQTSQALDLARRRLAGAVGLLGLAAAGDLAGELDGRQAVDALAR